MEISRKMRLKVVALHILTGNAGAPVKATGGVGPEARF